MPAWACRATGWQTCRAQGVVAYSPSLLVPGRCSLRTFQFQACCFMAEKHVCTVFQVLVRVVPDGTGLRPTMRWRSWLMWWSGSVRSDVGVISPETFEEFAVYVLNYCRLPIRFKCCEDFERNQGKCLCPTLARVAHDQVGMLHESIGCRIMDARLAFLILSCSRGNCSTYWNQNFTDYISWSCRQVSCLVLAAAKRVLSELAGCIAARKTAGTACCSSLRFALACSSVKPDEARERIIAGRLSLLLTKFGL
jgi:hypothetical protein